MDKGGGGENSFEKIIIYIKNVEEEKNIFNPSLTGDVQNTIQKHCNFCIYLFITERHVLCVMSYVSC